MEHKTSLLDWVALLLVVIGALNWGLIALANFDLVAACLAHVHIKPHCLWVGWLVWRLVIYYLVRKLSA